MLFILCLTSIFFVHTSQEASTVEENCDDILCSHVFDPVCGVEPAPSGGRVIRRYQNACHLAKIKCRLKPHAELRQVPDKICNIKKKTASLYRSGRRAHDFNIVGAHQACNHTCPTYCVDTYEPVCAQIYRPGMAQGSTMKPMINHCHVDLFSCSMGVNVTTHVLSKCFRISAQLMFMYKIAAMKSLKLLDDIPMSDPGAGRKG